MEVQTLEDKEKINIDGYVKRTKKQKKEKGEKEKRREKVKNLGGKRHLRILVFTVCRVPK